MKTVYLVLIGILLAVILWLILKPAEKSMDLSQVKEAQSKVHKAEAIKLTAITKAREDSVKFDSINRSKDKEIARLKRLAAKARTVHVDTVILQDKEVGVYVQALDSIIIQQDSQIADLKTQTSDQWQSFNKLIHASDSVSEAHKELNKAFQGSLDLQAKENKKLKRNNQLLKFGIVAVPLAVVGGIILIK